jgi:hypothetical protein
VRRLFLRVSVLCSSKGKGAAFQDWGAMVSGGFARKPAGDPLAAEER